jgi:hypothetical protein
MTAALFKRMLYLIATVSSVAIFFLETRLPQAAWLLAAAFLLVNITLETTLLRRSMVIAATGLVTALLIFISLQLRIFLPAQYLMLALVTGVCTYGGVVKSNDTYPFFVVNFLVVLSLYSETNAPPIVAAAYVVLGMLVTLVAQLLLLPFFTRDEHRRSEAQVFYRLDKLASVILSCFTTSDYSENVYLYERRVHKQKIKCLGTMAELAARETGITKPARCLSTEMQTFFEIILDIGQLRRRVTDHTVFALCPNEMIAIQLSIALMFRAFASRQNKEQLELSMLSFERDLYQLENIFETVIKVTAREPLAFVLFLSALKSLLQHGRQLTGMLTLEVAE